MRLGLNVTVRLALAVLLSGGASAAVQAQTFAQPPAKAQAPPPAAPAGPQSADKPSSAGGSPDSLPVDIDRVRQLAEKRPVLKLDENQLRFYVLVYGRQPKFSDFVGDYDLLNGPTRGGAAMTHREFLSMVTPRELNELFGSTSSSSFAMFQAALMNAAGQLLIKKAVQQLRNARDEREVQEIRERIDQELSALAGKSQ